jgi:hypothetical protein
MGFFVPPGTAARWIATGVRTAGAGTWIVVPYPGRATGGVRWLVPPDGTRHLTDPVLLELAMHEAAERLAEHDGVTTVTTATTCKGSGPTTDMLVLVGPSPAGETGGRLREEGLP